MEKENEIRNLVFYGNYFWKFYNVQNKKTQKKISWIFILIKTLKFIPGQYFKHMEGTKGIYEIRVQSGNDIFRILCCFDEGNLIVLFNAFQKKTEKTPKNEIELAERLRNEYYESKKK